MSPAQTRPRPSSTSNNISAQGLNRMQALLNSFFTFFFLFFFYQVWLFFSPLCLFCAAFFSCTIAFFFFYFFLVLSSISRVPNLRGTKGFVDVIYFVLHNTMCLLLPVHQCNIGLRNKCSCLGSCSSLFQLQQVSVICIP